MFPCLFARESEKDGANKRLSTGLLINDVLGGEVAKLGFELGRPGS